jgi:hypothetical protein
MADPSTPVFLRWLAERLEFVYLESPNIDFVLRLKHEAERARTLITNLSQNERTYQLVESGEAPFMDGSQTYLLRVRAGVGHLGSKLRLTQQQADDISRQLDASVDYFND